MNKMPLRPLKLVRLPEQISKNNLVVENNDVKNAHSWDEANEISPQSHSVTAINADQLPSPTALPPSLLTQPPATAIPHPSESETSAASDNAARSLLQRTPSSYFINQVYGLWFFLSWFFLTIIITRSLSTVEYGIFAIALSAFNTVAYIVAFGIEDAITTYVPRVLAEHGQGAAAHFIRQLLSVRLFVLIVSAGIMLFGMPVLATIIAHIPISGTATIAKNMKDPLLLSHITPIAFYVFGNGINNLLSAVCAGVMRMRIVLVVNGLAQVAMLAFGFVVLQLGWTVNGLLWMLALVSLVSSAAFVIWLAPLLFTPKTAYTQPLRPVFRLGLSAWLTNIVNGALFKQTSILLLGYFTISLVQIGYFNLSFQLADSANLLLVAGFVGVGGSALAASFVGQNRQRLARSWQILIKIETLLVAPLLIFCMFNASNITHAIYGTRYDPVGPLFAIFLFFNTLVRVLGTTIHQSTLYVIGKPRLVVLAQWIGLAVVILTGIALVPRFGPAGALIADGIAKTVTGLLLLLFLWRDLPRKYPLGFTLRFIAASTLASLPSLLWHPNSRTLLIVSGLLFLVLCIGILLLIKPLNNEDIDMVQSVQPRLVPYLKWFARHAESDEGLWGTHTH